MRERLAGSKAPGPTAPVGTTRDGARVVEGGIEREGWEGTAHLGFGGGGGGVASVETRGGVWTPGGNIQKLAAHNAAERIKKRKPKQIVKPNQTHTR